MCDKCEGFDPATVSLDDVLLSTGVGLSPTGRGADALAATPAALPLTMMVMKGDINGPRVHAHDAMAIAILPMAGLAQLVAAIEHQVTTWTPEDRARYNAEYDQQVCRYRAVGGGA